MTLHRYVKCCEKREKKKNNLRAMSQAGTLRPSLVVNEPTKFLILHYGKWLIVQRNPSIHFLSYPGLRRVRSLSKSACNHLHYFTTRVFSSSATNSEQVYSLNISPQYQPILTHQTEADIFLTDIG